MWKCNNKFFQTQEEARNEALKDIQYSYNYYLNKSPSPDFRTWVSKIKEKIQIKNNIKYYTLYFYDYWQRNTWNDYHKSIHSISYREINIENT